MTESHTTRDRAGRSGRKVCWWVLLLTTFLLGAHLRTVGVFRGLQSGSVYHPDEPKQVAALFNYLHGGYIWYTGSLFYDGYPYGLNHVDEWLIRPVLLARNACMSTFCGSSWTGEIPSRSALYYWARTLRVLYGIIVMIVAYAMARRLFRKPSDAWLVLLLTAIAPLSFCVTHFATGDIGVDLFGGVALLLLVVFARKATYRYSLGAGFATGIAFGCKYNGLLCGIAIALFAFLNLVSRRRFRAFLATAATSLAGCAAGIVASTPALLLNFKRTSHDIIANFKFIRDYSVSDEEQALSFARKAWLGLTRNSVDVIQSLGWVVTGLALVGLIASIVCYVRRPKHGSFECNENAILRVKLAVVALPFITLLLSLTGKLEVQPFHFSYLQVPLVLGAVTGYIWLRRCSWRGTRPLATALAVAAIVELGADAAHERFYWQRDDNIMFVDSFPSTVIASPWHYAGNILRDTAVEGENVSGFRNRKTFARSPQAAVWKQIACTPLPCVPYPFRHDWIFMNGPLFPRNDRMIHVGADGDEEGHLVFHSPPPAGVAVGLRSTAWPVRVVIDLGEDSAAVDLLPDTQEVITLQPGKWRSSRALPDGTRAYLVPVRIHTEGGNTARAETMAGITATFFATEKELARYELFGGTATTPVPNLLPSDIPTSNLVQVLEDALFVGEDACGTTLDASRRQARRCRFPESATLLPGGCYVLEADITVMSERAVLACSLDAIPRMNGDNATAAEPMTFARGGHRLTHAFSKTLSPYLCQVCLACREGKCRVNSWRIKPDTPTIVADLTWLATSEQLPPWSRRFGQEGNLDGATEGGTPGIDIVFDDTIHVCRFSLPGIVSNTQPLQVACEIDLLDYGYEAFDEAAFFIHLMDAGGGMAGAAGFTLRDAVTASEMRRCLAAALPPGLAAGTYEIQVGMWNARTHQRLVPDGDSLSAHERRKKRIALGTLKVVAR